jgi:hypothetical protein
MKASVFNLFGDGHDVLKDLVQVEGRTDKPVYFDERGEAIDLVPKTRNV